MNRQNQITAGNIIDAAAESIALELRDYKINKIKYQLQRITELESQIKEAKDEIEKTKKLEAIPVAKTLYPTFNYYPCCCNNLPTNTYSICNTF